ncbi:hypothetical protein M2475_001853 [Breznakia sp. PF5-3]|uniref:hypothetical protein n=1 Tax=unclassified Breznakia TaxID=2623764 RepID=UPI002406C906|nr:MULTISPECIES: hypothetical protein [unclassified Breznakia]MDF9825398.1 hypothetical protein [Breznakia sp. PM6-1]MDF9836276.1 hypothetical protein [Breznakia sp. PF5-3]MDF9837572.1 hypothetical protein [Breznakia sp. PFB2-8]MDF9860185.1 hypothetical protein [Breznakia sp. PH5-24]
MKKNKSMRIASGLLVLTLITMSIISGTFAKYTTAGNGDNQARVAKWGVTIGVDKDFFGQNYDDKANGNTISKDAKSATVSVVSSTADNVVAPGTKNTSFNLGITGKPEVDGVINGELASQNFSISGEKYYRMKEVAITSAAEYTAYKSSAGALDLYVIREYSGSDVYAKTNGFTKAGDKFYAAEVACDLKKADGSTGPNYYPVVFKLTDQAGNDWNGYTNPTGSAAIHTDTLAQVTTKFNSIYKTSGVNFEAGENLSTKASLPKISWEWAFTSDDSTTNGKYDAADTLIGDVIAAQQGDTNIDLKLIASTGWSGNESNFAKESGLEGPYLGMPFNANSKLELKFNLKLTVTQRD